MMHKYNIALNEEQLKLLWRLMNEELVEFLLEEQYTPQKINEKNLLMGIVDELAIEICRLHERRVEKYEN